MALKALVGQKLMETVIKTDKKSSDKSIEWRVLVVDQLAMRMVSACCKMHAISAEGITIVEDINKRRQPLPTMDAVYLITPIQKSIQALMKDFDEPGRNMYRAAHIYFTEACPDDLFNLLSKAKVAKFIKTLKEINISYVAYERQVFSLDTPETFQFYYNPAYASSRTEHMERMAEQIATLCATLKEFPSIRYRANFGGNQNLAQLVYDKLKAYKNDDPTMGEGAEKAKSLLLILDRGFDITTPVLHELTFQAMVHDLLAIENDVFKYDGKEVLLDENDELWVELRHSHIADVTRSVTQNMKKFTESKRLPQGEKQSIRDLSTMIKKMPQYQKELRKYSTHLKLAEDCLKMYENNVKRVCQVEQDLATGLDVHGEAIKEPMHSIMPLLLDQQMSNYDKMRIIILYIISKNGVSDENLNKVIKHAQLSPEEKQAIINLSHLGLNAVLYGDRRKMNDYPRRKRENHHRFDSSRWVPIVKDIMEDCIDDNLDSRNFPYLVDRAANSGYVVMSHNAISARYGQWHKDKVHQPIMRNVPHLIVFVIGGIAFSEMRCAYEMNDANKNWEVIIGSSHIATPENFLANLQNLTPKK